MKELTYILGAGASFQSIPIVKTFSNRFNTFLQWIEDGIIKDARFEAAEKQKFGLLHNLGKNLNREFESHQSFDTYFKKLFHTKQNDRIREGKKILNLYFIWEHLSTSQPKPEKYDGANFWKQSSLDKRYDALVAGLLKPIPEADPYCQVNFITWNYDLNLLLSLKNYFHPEGTINDFINNISKENGVWEINHKISVINMNGYFYCSNFNSLPSLNNSVTHHMIYQKIKEDKYFDNDYVDNDSELISFAWESNNKILPIAKEKIAHSDTIVVIGYTFPLYNRLIDLAYLDKNKIINKPFIIQDPDADNLKQNIIDYYGLAGYSIKTLLPFRNCDNFYIPSNIFGVTDGYGEYHIL